MNSTTNEEKVAVKAMKKNNLVIVYLYQSVGKKQRCCMSRQDVQ